MFYLPSFTTMFLTTYKTDLNSDFLNSRTQQSKENQLPARPPSSFHPEPCMWTTKPTCLSSRCTSHERSFLSTLWAQEPFEQVSPRPGFAWQGPEGAKVAHGPFDWCRRQVAVQVHRGWGTEQLSSLPCSVQDRAPLGNLRFSLSCFFSATEEQFPSSPAICKSFLREKFTNNYTSNMNLSTELSR